MSLATLAAPNAAPAATLAPDLRLQRTVGAGPAFNEVLASLPSLGPSRESTTRPTPSSAPLSDSSSANGEATLSGAPRRDEQSANAQGASDAGGSATASGASPAAEPAPAIATPSQPSPSPASAVAAVFARRAAAPNSPNPLSYVSAATASDPSDEPVLAAGRVGNAGRRSSGSSAAADASGSAPSAASPSDAGTALAAPSLLIAAGLGPAALETPPRFKAADPSQSSAQHAASATSVGATASGIGSSAVSSTSPPSEPAIAGSGGTAAAWQGPVSPTFAFASVGGGRAFYGGDFKSATTGAPASTTGNVADTGSTVLASSLGLADPTVGLRSAASRTFHAPVRKPPAAATGASTSSSSSSPSSAQVAAAPTRKAGGAVNLSNPRAQPSPTTTLQAAAPSTFGDLNAASGSIAAATQLGPIAVSDAADAVAEQAEAVLAGAPTNADSGAATPNPTVAKQLEIKLEPDGLGALTVKMRLEDGKLAIVLEVTTGAAESAMKGQMDALASRLSSQDQTLASLSLVRADSQPQSPESANATLIDNANPDGIRENSGRSSSRQQSADDRARNPATASTAQSSNAGGRRLNGDLFV